jgi:hypothetical protein
MASSICRRRLLTLALLSTAADARAQTNAGESSVSDDVVELRNGDRGLRRNPLPAKDFYLDLSFYLRPTTANHRTSPPRRTTMAPHKLSTAGRFIAAG